jgi:acetate kinase
VAHGDPEYNSLVLIDDEVLTQLEHYMLPCTSRTISRRSDRFSRICPGSRRWPASIRPFTATTQQSRIILLSTFMRKGCAATGFTGLSYEYIAPETAAGRVIVAHLGSGASMCALSGGRSIESTMGFTALDGLPMGTRPGQIDPGVIIYLMAQNKMSAADVHGLFVPRLRAQRSFRNQ